MHSFAPTLVAAGLDWLEGLLPVVFVLIWIVSQVMNLFRNAAGKPAERAAGRPVNPPRPVPRPARPAAEPPGGDIDQEIRDFLARSLRGDSPAPPARPAPVRRPKSPAATPAAKSAARIAPDRLPTPSRPKPPAQISVSDRGGGRIGRAGYGDDVSEHVAAAFAHDLAHEAPSVLGAEVPAAGPPVVGELIEAMRSPTELRKLIMLREVLDRPTHRW